MKNETKNVPTISVKSLSNNEGIALDFAHGKMLQLELVNLSPDIVMQATLHGLKQKLVDAAAISRNPDTGRSATIEDKYNAVREVYERLLAGQWNKTREGSAGGNGGLLLSALVRLYTNKTLEQLRDYLESKTDSEKAALRVNPKVATIIETIKAERAAKSGGDVIDTDLLLEELA